MPNSKQRKKILLVESDDFYVGVIETFVKLFLKLDITVAGTIKSAQETLSTCCVNLVVLDLDDKYEAYSFLLYVKDKYGVEVPVIAISNESKNRDQALGDGAQAFLQKPFRVKELEFLVTRLLNV